MRQIQMNRRKQNSSSYFFISKIGTKLSAENSNHLEEFNEQINELSQLKDGWRFGEGKAVNPKIALLTRKYFTLAHTSVKITDFNLFPINDGGCMISFYLEDLCLSITINPSEEIDITVEKGISHNYEHLDDIENASEKELEELLKKYFPPQFSYSRWKSLGHYIPENMILASKDSEALASKIHPMAVVYQSLIRNASMKTKTGYAHISENFIRKSPVTHLYSGSSKRQTSPRQTSQRTLWSKKTVQQATSAIII